MLQQYFMRELGPNFEQMVMSFVMSDL